MNIDEINSTILKSLLNDSRVSFTKIAKDSNVSVNSVRKRYKRLCKARIINGAIILVDPRSLGYKCIVTLWVTTSREDESEVIEFLKSKPYCCRVFRSVFEKANIATIISLHEVTELSETMQDIESNPLIKDTTAFIWDKTTDVEHPDNLRLSPSNNKTHNESHIKTNIGKLEKAKITITDRQIARILSKDSRMPFTTIAQELNISTKKVTQRFNKLRRTILTGSTITVNLEKLGYNAMIHILIKVKNKSKITETLAKVLQIPNVIAVLKFVGGTYDLLADIPLSNCEDIFKLEAQFNTISEIEQMDVSFSKTYTSWPLDLFSSLL